MTTFSAPASPSVSEKPRPRRTCTPAVAKNAGTDGDRRHLRRILAGLARRTSLDLEPAAPRTGRRHARRERGGLDPRNPGQLRDEPVVECAAQLRRFVLRVEPDLHAHQVARVDADVGGVKLQEAPNHQAGADQQHDCQRQLHDDHRRAEPARAPSSARAAAAFLQDLVDVRLRDLQRRREAEENTGQHADRRRGTRRRRSPS